MFIKRNLSVNLKLSFFFVANRFWVCKIPIGYIPVAILFHTLDQTYTHPSRTFIDVPIRNTFFCVCVNMCACIYIIYILMKCHIHVLLVMKISLCIQTRDLEDRGSKMRLGGLGLNCNNLHFLRRFGVYGLLLEKAVTQFRNHFSRISQVVELDNVPLQSFQDS